ncbi:hypothetical protein ACIB24_21140 [Spongisporangium articulatum]|uniref:DUF218 domain-containing protein n=1 Tax=Spongisporangium articulatum TaxID=3362603 RepID=A0ABW8AT82_9ACTN
MRIRRLVVGGLAALVVLAAAGWPVYVHPRTDSASASDPADAVVALGGNVGTAYVAQRMFREGLARHLVVSDPYGQWEPGMYGVCPARELARELRPNRPQAANDGAGVTCFAPDPSTTRGEAMEIGRLARENGWDDVIVLAPTFHITRSRVIVERCYPGRLRMVDPQLSYPVYWWPWQYLYQTAGFAKVVLRHGC